MKVVVNAAVSYAVSEVEVNNIVLRKSTSGNSATVSYKWLDSTGSVIRRDRRSFSVADLAAVSPEAATMIDGVLQATTLAVLDLGTAGTSLRVLVNQALVPVSLADAGITAEAVSAAVGGVVVVLTA